MRGLLDGAGLQREPEGPLQRGVTHRFGGRSGALTTVAFAGKEQRGMTMSFPELAQEQERAPGQRDIPIVVALAGADVQEHALGIDVADLQPKPLAQAQAEE
jgi:hypothetical protein